MASKAPKLTRGEISAFRAQIWAFYGHFGRKLPWRGTRNPYKILVSELMLQQTQVSRVLEKYPEFLRKFPTIATLASAPLSDVLRVWQGMGYNRRARYLHDSAQMIVRDFSGKIPQNARELCTLAGVGNYTANAILAFAFNIPTVFVETNIRRIFIHHFFPKKMGVSDKEILLFVEATLDASNPREWYYALMDYGAHLPKIIHHNPNIKSKHYAKQSTFKGSLRELRGKIIRALDDSPKTITALRRTCNNDLRTMDALSALIKDKLICHEKRIYKLA